jgi:hypothetical protein
VRKRRQLCRALFDVCFTKFEGKELVLSTSTASSTSAAEVKPDDPME